MSKKQWVHSVEWKCLVCPENPEFEHGAMMAHMRDIHGIDTKKAGATRTALLCLDGSGFYQNTFEYSVGEMKFLKYEYGEKKIVEETHE